MKWNENINCSCNLLCNNGWKRVHENGCDYNLLKLGCRFINDKTNPIHDSFGWCSEQWTLWTKITCTFIYTRIV